MTVSGSICTRHLIDRTLICNAILYHFQITIMCGRINRPCTPTHTFSPLVAHLSNSSLFVPATCEQKDPFLPYRASHSATTIYSPTHIPKSISTTSLHSKPLLQLLSRDDLLINFLVSAFTPYKNFTSFEFNLGRMCLKQISSLFTIKSHTSLSPIRLFCARVLTPDMI